MDKRWLAWDNLLQQYGIYADMWEVEVHWKGQMNVLLVIRQRTMFADLILKVQDEDLGNDEFIYEASAG